MLLYVIVQFAFPYYVARVCYVVALTGYMLSVKTEEFRYSVIPEKGLGAAFGATSLSAAIRRRHRIGPRQIAQDVVIQASPPLGLDRCVVLGIDSVSDDDSVNLWTVGLAAATAGAAATAFATTAFATAAVLSSSRSPPGHLE